MLKYCSPKDCLTPNACHENGRCLEASGEIAPPEVTGPLPVVGSGGVVGLRVESVYALIENWSNRAHACNQRAEAWTRNGGFGARELSAQETEAQRIYRICIRELRAEMAYASQRQPKPNSRDEGRA